MARAARAAGRTKSSTNLVWPLALVAVVALGSVLIFLSRPDKAEASPPILGDHWHAAYGIFVCGEFLPPLNDAKTDTSGIHAHGDGLIHIHPFSTRYTGDGASLGAFADTAGLELSDDALTVPGRDQLDNGDDCGGQPGKVQVKVWELTDNEGRLLEGDFADYAPDEGDLVTIAFAPDGADIPQPPSAGNAPTDVAGAPQTPRAPAPPTSAGETGTTSTVPPTSAGETATSTTAPAP